MSHPKPIKIIQLSQITENLQYNVAVMLSIVFLAGPSCWNY